MLLQLYQVHIFNHQTVERTHPRIELMIPGLLKAIANRLKPRRVWMEDEVIVYAAAGKEWRLAVCEIVQINAYPNIEPPSRKWGIVYNGPDVSITTVEDMERFREVFLIVMEQLGQDGKAVADAIAMLRYRNPVFERRRTVSQ